MTENQQNRIIDYLTGELWPEALAAFTQELSRDRDLRFEVRDFEETASCFTLDSIPVLRAPDGLFDEISAIIDSRKPEVSGPCVVVTDREGCVQWVNEAFTALCGYTLPEIVGRKPGSFLQGPLTDPLAAQMMRRSVGRLEPCFEEILNYHKSGQPYWVSISITPVIDDTREVSHFVAVERRIEDRPIPVAA